MVVIAEFYFICSGPTGSSITSSKRHSKTQLITKKAKQSSEPDGSLKPEHRVVGCRVSYVTGVQLRLAYSWARPAILVAGKGTRGMGGGGVVFLLFIHFRSWLSFLSLSFISSTFSSISFLPFSGRRHKMTHKGDVSLSPNSTNQSKLEQRKINIEDVQV